MIPTELKDKLLMLLEKAWVSAELAEKVKEELSSEKEEELSTKTKEELPWEWVVEVKAVSIEAEPLSDENINEMSEDEVKEAFKQHLKWMKKDEKKETPKDKILNKMKEMY